MTWLKFAYLFKKQHKQHPRYIWSQISFHTLLYSIMSSRVYISFLPIRKAFQHLNRFNITTNYSHERVFTQNSGHVLDNSIHLHLRHKAASSPLHICSEAVQGRFCIHWRMPPISVIIVLTDCGRALNWNWMLQALVVAKSGKALVRIEGIQDIVGMDCVTTRQFSKVDKDSSSRFQRMHHEILAHSSRESE